MSAEAALLAAIAVAPNENTVRLVYADWLDEHDRSEGTFLRCECELVATPIGSAAWHATFKRYQQLRLGVSPQWFVVVNRHPPDAWLAEAARSAWVRIEKWCQQHHPRLLEVLQPGATTAEIDAIEEIIGRPLPADVRESLAIHNGSSENSFIFSLELFSANDVIPVWEKWKGLEDHNDEFRDTMESFPTDAIALDYANPGWIALTRAAHSDHIGVDLAPGPTGTVGQVINFGRDEHHKCVLASGWAEFLADCATFLESGAVKVLYPESDLWGDCCGEALGGHPHDVLRKWRQAGTWPLSSAG